MDIVSMILSVGSIILTIYYGRKASQCSSQIWAHVEAKVIDTLMTRLDARTLKGADQLKGIIQNITTEYGVGSMTTKQMEAILRRIALKYEYLPGDHRRALKALESIRKEIAPQGLPLASIAKTNPMLAFQLMTVGFVVSLCVTQFSYVWISSQPHPIINYTLLAIEIATAFATLSVYTYARRKAINTK